LLFEGCGAGRPSQRGAVVLAKARNEPALRGPGTKQSGNEAGPVRTVSKGLALP
jgi:hypothetical protein